MRPLPHGTRRLRSSMSRATHDSGSSAPDATRQPRARSGPSGPEIPSPLPSPGDLTEPEGHQASALLLLL